MPKDMGRVLELSLCTMVSWQRHQHEQAASIILACFWRRLVLMRALP